MTEINKKKLDNKITDKEFPSLIEAFHLGDRVKRTYYNENGNIESHSGIIMAIYNDSIDIFWDTLNGKYQPDKIKDIFNNYKIEDIFSGNKNYSPIKKDRYIFKNIFKKLQ